MPLEKAAWIATTVICVFASVILLASGYLGYFGVMLALAGSAAINLR